MVSVSLDLELKRVLQENGCLPAAVTEYKWQVNNLEERGREEIERPGAPARAKAVRTRGEKRTV